MTDTTEGEAVEASIEDTSLAPQEGQDQAAEGQTPGDDAAAAADPEQPSKPPRKTAQERIDELTAARREAERDAEYWRSRATQPPQAQPHKPAERTEDAEPDPDNYTHGDLDAGFIRDHARYHARQEFRQEQARADAQNRTRTALSTFEQRVTEQFPEGQTDGIAKLSSMPVLSRVIQEIVLESEVGPKIADHLGSNQRELSRISALPPLQQARELVKLEMKLSSPAAPQAKTVSDAPAVTPQVRGSGGRFGVAPDTSDFAAFEKLADASG